jgi:hypothetical protein
MVRSHRLLSLVLVAIDVGRRIPKRKMNEDECDDDVLNEDWRLDQIPHGSLSSFAVAGVFFWMLEITCIFIWDVVLHAKPEVTRSRACPFGKGLIFIIFNPVVSTTRPASPSWTCTVWL